VSPGSAPGKSDRYHGSKLKDFSVFRNNTGPKRGGGPFSPLPYIEGYGRYFLVVKVQDKIEDPGGFDPEIGNGKDQMGYGGGVPHSLDLHITPDGLYAHFAVQIPGFYPEAVTGKLPKIITDPYDHRKLGMNAGEIPGNDGVKSSDNGELPAVFLGKITECENFYLH
jgi:hypothetical protein